MGAGASPQAAGWVEQLLPRERGTRADAGNSWQRCLFGTKRDVTPWPGKCNIAVRKKTLQEKAGSDSLALVSVLGWEEAALASEAASSLSVGLNRGGGKNS